MRRISHKFGLFGLLLVTFAAVGRSAAEVDLKPVTGTFDHAEGPHWDHRVQKLYFVDIHSQTIHSLDPITNDITSTYIETGPVGVVVPVADMPDTFIVAAGRELLVLDWKDDHNVTNADSVIRATVDQDHPGNRFNDGKVDSNGRFWVGTIGPEVHEVVQSDQASLYRVSSDFKPKTEIFPVTNSNGLAWNAEDNTFYYIDTPTRQIASFDYDTFTGTISKKRIAFDLNTNNITGLPDGMTIDTDGNLWIALFNGGAVINVNPNTGELLRTIPFPVHKVTSLAFGNPLLDTLFVTTSRHGLNQEELEKQPLAGSVFAVEGLEVLGLPANSFKCGIECAFD